MEHDVIDDLDRRLRAARPLTARVDEDAFDAELLARVRAQPVARRRHFPRAVAIPLAAAATFTATAVLMLGGGPGDIGGPSSAAAISQAALRWLDPQPGTMLHVRSVETSGAHTITRELWQSADDPESGRELVTGAHTYETSGDAFYDPATDTIYDPPGDSAKGGHADATEPAGPEGKTAASDKNRVTEIDREKKTALEKEALAKRGDAERRASGAPGASKSADEELPAGDPVVAKVRTLLRDGRMEVTGREVHNGTDAWVVSLKPGEGRPVWTLWVSVADGKPLELRDPGRDASEEPQVIRWPTYEVLSDNGADADRLLTLTGAHPTASVERDAAKVAAARERLRPQMR